MSSRIDWNTLRAIAKSWTGLAADLGVSYVYLWQLRKGERKPSKMFLRVVEYYTKLYQ